MKIKPFKNNPNLSIIQLFLLVVNKLQTISKMIKTKPLLTIFDDNCSAKQ